MMKASVRMLTKSTLFIIFGLMVLNLSAIPVSFGATTQLKVSAPTTDIQVPTHFNVDIDISDVTDLFAWQIMLYYNPAVLTWINASYPPGHVFEGKTFVPVAPVNDSDAKGVYIWFFATLQGEEPRFTGSGILCRISFEAKAAGTSTLNFSRPLGEDTWLWNYDLEDIPADLVDGSVTVVGIDIREPSAISINVDPSSIMLGENVTISGALNVTVADGTPVYIKHCYIYGGEDVCSTTTVYTEDSQYSHIWEPDENRTWTIRARWDGNMYYLSAISETKSVEVASLLTWIKVQPKKYTADWRLPPPTPPFTINITIQNVTDLSEWKIKLNFNQTILEALEVLIPSYNIFGTDHILLESLVNNTQGFVQVSANSSAASFNGSGILFQTEFRGIAAPEYKQWMPFGLSNLEFDITVTRLKNSTDAEILFNYEEPAGVVEINAAEKLASYVTLEVPSQVKVGSDATLRVGISPIAAGKQVNVTITYRKPEMSERILAIVETDNYGKYSYIWNANETGTYTFNASWIGDEFYFGASVEKTMNVVEEIGPDGGLDITTYAIIAVVVVIIVVAIVVYLKKFKKP